MERAIVICSIWIIFFLIKHTIFINSAPTFEVSKLPENDAKFRLSRAASDLPKFRLWRKGVIPYRIALELSSNLTCLIEDAMFHIMQSTCVVFRPVYRIGPVDRYFLYVINKEDGHRCWAESGTQIRNKSLINQPTLLSLGSKRCETFAAIVHELMHVLGFKHEHARFDRDQYVKINHENIKPEKSHNFNITSKVPGRNYTEFDFDSIMLYSSNTSSFDNKSLTIESKIPGKVVPNVWTKRGLSELDVKSVNMLYKCDEVQVNSKICYKLVRFMHSQKCKSKSSYLVSLRNKCKPEKIRTAYNNLHFDW